MLQLLTQAKGWHLLRHRVTNGTIKTIAARTKKLFIVPVLCLHAEFAYLLCFRLQWQEPLLGSGRTFLYHATLRSLVAPLLRSNFSDGSDDEMPEFLP